MSQALLKMSSSCASLYAPLELKALSCEGVFEGYASTYDNKDSHQDVMRPGAFRRTLSQFRSQKKWPHLLWQHKQDEPLGMFEDIIENPKGLYVVGRLLLELQRAREAYALMKQGIISGLSIGFYPVLSRYQAAQKARHIFQVNLVEISLVTIPANAKARVHHVKSCHVVPPTVSSLVSSCAV